MEDEHEGMGGAAENKSWSKFRHVDSHDFEAGRVPMNERRKNPNKVLVSRIYSLTCTSVSTFRKLYVETIIESLLIIRWTGFKEKYIHIFNKVKGMMQQEDAWIHYVILFRFYLIIQLSLSYVSSNMFILFVFKISFSLISTIFIYT